MFLIKQIPLISIFAPLLLTLTFCQNNGEKDSPLTTTDKIPQDSLAIETPDSVVSKVGIKMDQTGGVYEIPCKVDGVPMKFIFDTGASNVCLSLTEALFLYKNDHLEDSDFIGESYSKIADGSIIENMEIMLRSIVVGGIEIKNVKATIVQNLTAPLLLGQTAIQKFGKIEFVGDSLYITNKTPVLINQPKDNQIIENVIYEGSRQSRLRFGFIRSPKVETLLEKAVEAYNNDMPDKAIDYCKQARDINKKDWRVLAFLISKKHYDGNEEFLRLNKRKSLLH